MHISTYFLLETSLTGWIELCLVELSCIASQNKLLMTAQSLNESEEEEVRVEKCFSLAFSPSTPPAWLTSNECITFLMYN